MFMNMNVPTPTVRIGEAVGEVGADTAKLTWNLYSHVCQSAGIEGTTSAGIVFLGAILVCIIVAYLIGSINPAIIFSKLFFKEDIRSYGSGNAGATNTLRTYGTKMAVLIFVLDLVKAALAVVLGSLILTRSIGGAIAALFVVLGHMFPVYYKFKGGKGVACTAMCILLLSPVSFVIVLSVFLLIAIFTRFVSLGSIVCAMLYPFLNYVFYPRNAWITLSAFFTGALVVFMHRENIKRLLAGKESKFSFKKTDKHAAAEHDGAVDNATERQIQKAEKAYGEGDFVKCACGRLIPRSRKECVYCGEKNPAYLPSENDKARKSKKK